MTINSNRQNDCGKQVEENSLRKGEHTTSFPQFPREPY